MLVNSAASASPPTPWGLRLMFALLLLLLSGKDGSRHRPSPPVQFWDVTAKTKPAFQHGASRRQQHPGVSPPGRVALIAFSLGHWLCGWALARISGCPGSLCSFPLRDLSRSSLHLHFDRDPTFNRYYFAAETVGLVDRVCTYFQGRRDGAWPLCGGVPGRHPLHSSEELPCGHTHPVLAHPVCYPSPSTAAVTAKWG